MPDKENIFYFEGFDSPAFTPTPDAVFDVLMPQLSEAELKVLLYVVRRTFGFKKDMDAISVSQMVNGITTRDGRVLDRGTGLSKASVWRGINGLIGKGVLIKQTATTELGDSDINVYSLRFRAGVVSNLTHPSLNNGVVSNLTHPSLNLIPPVVSNLSTQERAVQETVKQEPGKNPSNDRTLSTEKKEYDDARLTLLEYISDLSLEFLDTASVGASTSRAVNLYARAGFSLDDFINAMIDARAITKERTASIKRRTQAGDKSKMAYFFTVLEDRLGLKAG